MILKERIAICCKNETNHKHTVWAKCCCWSLQRWYVWLPPPRIELRYCRFELRCGKTVSSVYLRDCVRAALRYRHVGKKKDINEFWDSIIKMSVLFEHSFVALRGQSVVFCSRKCTEWWRARTVTVTVTVTGTHSPSLIVVAIYLVVPEIRLCWGAPAVVCGRPVAAHAAPTPFPTLLTKTMTTLPMMPAQAPAFQRPHWERTASRRRSLPPLLQPLPLLPWTAQMTVALFQSPEPRRGFPQYLTLHQMSSSTSQAMKRPLHCLPPSQPSVWLVRRSSGRNRGGEVSRRSPRGGARTGADGVGAEDPCLREARSASPQQQLQSRTLR